MAMPATRRRPRHCLLVQMTMAILSAGVAAFCIFTVPAAWHYHLTRAYRPARCTVLAASVHANVTLQCEHSHVEHGVHAEGEDFTMPCLVIRVAVRTSADPIVTRQAVLCDAWSNLHETENLTCALHKCSGDRDHNSEHVVDFRRKYGKPGEQYVCYHNPHSFRRVVLLHVFTRSHLLHAVIWPCLLVVLGLIPLVLLLRNTSCGVHSLAKCPVFVASGKTADDTVAFVRLEERRGSGPI